MKNYLLDITFYAGSDEAEDIDRGLFLLSSKLELTKEDFIKIFAAINKAIDPYSDDAEDLSISYEQGLNLNPFIEAVNFYTSFKIEKIFDNYGNISNIDNFYKIEQWQ